MSDKIWGDLLLMAGFGSGLYWFFDGFRFYRQYQVIATTPQSRIRSLAMGLVEVCGRTSGEATLASPLTHTPCLLFQVEIESWETDRGRGRWSHYWTDVRALTFYIADATGKVLIDPRHADYDLKKRAVREIGSSGGLSGLFRNGKTQTTTQPGATDQELTEYVAHLGFDPSLLVDPRAEELGKLVADRGVGSELHLPGGAILERAIQLAGPAARSGRFRLTEYLIAPGELYDVTGTCVENPGCGGNSERNLICKGEKESTFLISWRDARGVEMAVRKKAALRIFGGAALAIACLYLFIVLAEIGLI